MFCLTVMTFGFYQIYYNVRTTDQLRRAGGYIPSLIFLYMPVAAAFLESSFLPLLFAVMAVYFWHHYVKAYCQQVRRDQLSKTIIKYFVLWLIFKELPLWLFKFSQHLLSQPQFSDLSAFFITHAVALSLGLVIIVCLRVSLMKYLSFQRGFNKYVEQQK